MKKLLLIIALLIVSISNGQEVEEITLKHLKEYRTECYNDSTLLKRQHFMPEGEIFCLVDYECLNEWHYKDLWAHKETTFEGFIKWLEKQ